MKMNLKPALRYQFGVFLKEAASVLLVVVTLFLVSFVVMISIDSDSGSISFAGYGAMLAVFMFVIGIVNVRINLRLCMQFGVSRRTAFVSELLVILSAALILSIAGQIFMVLERAISSKMNFKISELYQLIYLRDAVGALTFSQRLQSLLVNTSLQLALCLFGMFFSLLFWRLNKIWTIVTVVAMVFLLNGTPLVIFRAGLDVTPFFRWIAASPNNFVLFFMIFAVVFAVINWLLLRKVNVKPAKL